MHQQFINTTPTQNWSTLGFNEYLLLVNPDKNVNGKVMEEKHKFCYDYQTTTGNTRPHITLAAFLCKQYMENELSYLIQTICNNYRSSTVTLHNYSGFSPNVIYLNVQNQQPIKNIAKGLKVLDNFLASHDCPPIKLTTHPHLTLARKLSEQIYYEAITKYKQQHFFESFTMNELVLIKRPYDGHKCKDVNTFNLLPLLSSQTTTTSYQLKLNL